MRNGERKLKLVATTELCKRFAISLSPHFATLWKLKLLVSKGVADCFYTALLEPARLDPANITYAVVWNKWEIQLQLTFNEISEYFNDIQVPFRVCGSSSVRRAKKNRK